MAGKKMNEITPITNITGTMLIPTVKTVNNVNTVEICSVDNMFGSIKESIYPESMLFLSTKNYQAGELVKYNNKIYKFTTSHSAGVWVGTDAIETTVANELKKPGVYETLTIQVKSGDGVLDTTAGTKILINNKEYQTNSSGQVVVKLDIGSVYRVKPSTAVGYVYNSLPLECIIKAAKATRSLTFFYAEEVEEEQET